MGWCVHSMEEHGSREAALRQDEELLRLQEEHDQLVQQQEAVKNERDYDVGAEGQEDEEGQEGEGGVGVNAESK